jgi:hypothetical protein
MQSMLQLRSCYRTDSVPSQLFSMVSRRRSFHPRQPTIHPFLDLKPEVPWCRYRDTGVVIPRNLNIFPICTLRRFDIAGPIQASDLQKQRFLRNLQPGADASSVAKACESSEIGVLGERFLIRWVPWLQPAGRVEGVWLWVLFLVAKDRPLVWNDDGPLGNVIALIDVVLGDCVGKACSIRSASWAASMSGNAGGKPPDSTGLQRIDSLITARTIGRFWEKARVEYDALHRRRRCS